jgi:hypothetical protein
MTLDRFKITQSSITKYNGRTGEKPHFGPPSLHIIKMENI